jgi:hypothetical protein
VTTELLVNATEQPAPDRNGKVPRDPAQPFERRGPAALGDLALDGAPEQVKDLWNDDHARDPLSP